jgi:WD40 repeat protein
MSTSTPLSVLLRRPFLILSTLVLGFVTSAVSEVVTDPAPSANLPDSGHAAPLAAVTYSPDGNQLVTLDTTGELRGRDVKDRKTIWKADIGAGARQLRQARDGAWLIASSSGAITLYEKPQAGKPLTRQREFAGPEVQAQLQTEAPLAALQLGDFALSADGSRLAVLTLETAKSAGASRDKPGARQARLRVWNAQNGQIAREWDVIPMATGTPDLAWSADGKTLQVALPEGTVQSLDPQSGALQTEWKPAGLAASSSTPDDAADAARERRLQQLPPELQERARQGSTRRGTSTNSATSLQGISSEGRFVLLATPGGHQLWDTRDNSQRILENSQRLGEGDETLFSPDSLLVAVRKGGGFWLWRTDGTQIGWARIPFLNYSALAFSPDGKHIALGDEAGVARQWATTAPLAKTAEATFEGFFQPWRHLSATPNGIIAATARGTAAIGADGTLRWFPTESIASPAELPEYAKSQTRPEILHVAAAPDGKLWVESLAYDSFSSTMSNAGIPRGELRARDTQTGAILWRQTDNQPARTIDNFHFLPDGTLLTAKGGGGGRSLRETDQSLTGLQARNGRSGEPLPLDIQWQDKVGFREPGNAEIMEVSPDGKWLLVSSGSGGNGLQIVDLAAKTVVHSFGANTAIDPGQWGLSPEAKWLARAGRPPGRSTLDLWDLSRARQPNSSAAPSVRLPLPSQGRTLAFSPDGSLAVGLSDGRLLFYTAPFSANATPKWETTPGNVIETLTFSADGKILWSGNGRGDLTARDAQSGQLQSTWRLLAPAGENAQPSWVRWARDGKVQTSQP